MEKVVGLIADLGDTRKGGGDSFCDRLNCRYTVYVLAIIALGITTKQYFGDTPIACWCPAHFTDSHVEFTNKVSHRGRIDRVSVLCTTDVRYHVRK